MTGTPDERDAEQRRRRRAWILAHHPDRGGDPDDFIAGLSRFDESAAAAPPRSAQPWDRPPSTDPPPDNRPTVYRSRSPLRRARRLVRTVRQVLDRQPPSRRVR